MKPKKPNWGKTPWNISFRAGARRLPDHANFVVVGGGFTGLAAAAWLSRMAPGKSVLLLEAGPVGNGASGRTGGVGVAQTAARDIPGPGHVVRWFPDIFEKIHMPA